MKKERLKNIEDLKSLIVLRVRQIYLVGSA